MKGSSLAKVRRSKRRWTGLSLERRAKIRISEPFSTTVSGVDSRGEPFELYCVLENMSSTGLYLKIPRKLEQGSEVAMTVKLSSVPSSGAGASIRGVTLRSEPQADESWGLAVAISECACV